MINSLFNKSKFQHSEYWVYDLETFREIFTCAIFNPGSGQSFLYEISDRKNDIVQFIKFLDFAIENDIKMVGYNNMYFDYPILHMIMELGEHCNLNDIWNKSQQIINTDWSRRFDHVIWQPLIKQVDLYKVMHFDNVNKATSLKMLECRMNMQSVQELPFSPDSTLTSLEKDKLIKYNWHDEDATYLFMREIWQEIQLRIDLSKRYDIDMTNMSDSKIGSEIFSQALNKAGIRCHKSVQTHRPEGIVLKDCIAGYVHLKYPSLQRIKDKFESRVIFETKGVFDDAVCIINGIEHIFGVGGYHASVKNKVFHEDEGHMLVAIDVKSYYPNLSICNKFYPEHLTQVFCDVYKNLYDERASHEKGTSANAALKIALNGTYGNSNNKYSAFYDPKFTMSITLTGQLSLAMLFENINMIEGCEFIFANTDSVCVKLPRNKASQLSLVVKWWEHITGGLELEYDYYKSLYVANVNNYIGEYDSGKLVRKGKYRHSSDLGWHQDHSKQVVSKTVEKWLLSGVRDERLITQHINVLDFIIHLKVPRNTRLMHGDDIVPNIIRYVVTNNGEPLSKTMPAKGEIGQYKRANKLTDEYFNQIMSEIGRDVWDERIHTKNQSVYDDRRSDVTKGFLVTLVTDLKGVSVDSLDINYDYYITEADKITEDFNYLT